MARREFFVSFVLLGLVAEICAQQSVAVLGGGVSGLTAAHELVERGFKVQVYERQDVLGGKARSYPVNGTGEGGRSDLPGEHGFRIFWNYYLNVFDTLQRIHYNSSLTVYDYMLNIGANELLTEHGPDIYIDFGPKSWQNFVDEWKNLTVDAHFLSKEEMDFGLKRAEILMTTCDERMREEFEDYSFGQFVGAQYRSENFTKFWLSLLHLGGINPEQADLGATANFIQSLNSPWDENIAIKVLKRPTNDAWIDPWVNQMTTDGAEFYTNMQIQSFVCKGTSMLAVDVLDTTTGKVSTVTADYYIFAVPMDKMLSILGNSDLSQCTDLVSLSGVPDLQTAWMAGMQFYLYEDVEVTDGFALYLDSPWRLSSVSFRQWWPDVNWSQMGDGKEGGIISAIVSNFTAPGILFNKPAIECTPEEVQQEVWAQLKAHLNKNGAVILNDDNLAGFSLDSSLSFEDGELNNEEPMFYASPGSWRNSPNATTEIANMFLCGDYVRAMSRVTPSGMEAANESGRRAVNALLSASQSKADAVNIFAPPRSPDFAAGRLEDEIRYKLGMPHVGCESRGCVATS